MHAFSQDLMADLFSHTREDFDGTYRNWIQWEKRMQEVRAIRLQCKN